MQITNSDLVKYAAEVCYNKLPTKKTAVKMLVALVALSGLAYAGYTHRAQIGAALANGYAAAQPRIANLATRARAVITSDKAVTAYKYAAVSLVVLTAGYYGVKAVNDFQYGNPLEYG